MAFDGFSIPPLSVPGVGSPQPPSGFPPENPSSPPPATAPDPFPPTSILPFPPPGSIPFPTEDPIPTPTLDPTFSPILPTQSSSPASHTVLSSSSVLIPSVFSPSSLAPSTPVSASSSPISAIGSQSTSTSTITSALPTGQLSPSQPAPPFLENKGARAGVFTVAAIIAVSLLIGLGAMIYRRRKRKRFDLDHMEAMAGYHSRAPIDGDYDYPSSHSHTDANYSSNYAYSPTDEQLAPSYSYPAPGMRERHVEPAAAYNNNVVTLYLPYPGSPHYEPQAHQRENPFGDFYPSPSGYDGYEIQPTDSGLDRKPSNSSEGSSILQPLQQQQPPPPRWPQLAELPAAFGNRTSDVLERPRPTLRVTNGLDDTRA